MLSLEIVIKQLIINYQLALLAFYLLLFSDLKAL